MPVDVNQIEKDLVQPLHVKVICVLRRTHVNLFYTLILFRWIAYTGRC